MAHDLPFVPVPLLWAKPLSFRIISCPVNLPTSLSGTAIYKCVRLYAEPFRDSQDP